MGPDADRTRTDAADTQLNAASKRSGKDVPGMLASAISKRYAAEEMERRKSRTEAAIRRAQEA